MLSSTDRALHAGLIRLAHAHPEFRKDLLPIIKEADFDPSFIGKQTVPVGEPASDAQKPWAKGQFTQQEFAELKEKQVAGNLSDGKADTKTASDKNLRAAIIRLAHAHPEFRKDLLPILK